MRRSKSFLISGILSLLLLLGSSLPTSAHTHLPSLDTSACGASVAQSLGDGAIDAFSCFQDAIAYLPGTLQKGAVVIVSFFSLHPDNWLGCSVGMEVDDLTTHEVVNYTPQTYDCLSDAKSSRKNISYGDLWWNAPFLPQYQHRYIVQASITYQYASGASFQLLLQSLPYLVS